MKLETWNTTCQCRFNSVSKINLVKFCWFVETSTGDYLNGVEICFLELRWDYPGLRRCYPNPDHLQLGYYELTITIITIYDTALSKRPGKKVTSQ